MSGSAGASVRDRLEFLGYRALALLVRVLPLRFLHGLGAVCGRGVFALRGKHVRWALENLRVAYPDASEEELRRLGADSYASFGRNAIDFVRAEQWSDEEVQKHVDVVGLEYVERGLAKGKGLFLISAHLGNFELVPRVYGALGRPALLIGRPMRNKLLYERLERSRTRSGAIQLIDRKQGALRMLRAIKRNETVGILMDQYVRRSQGVFVPLFGVRCSTSPAVAALTLRTGAALVCASVTRLGPDHHRVEFTPVEIPKPHDGADGGGDEIEALTAACNRALEERIRANPEQWMWGHRRFRYSPDLDPPLYTG